MLVGGKYALVMPRWLSQAFDLIRTHRARLALVFLGILAPLMVFGALAQEVWEREGFSWDKPTLLWIHSFATPTRDALAVWVSILGGIQVIGPITAIVTVALMLRSRWRQGVFFALCVAGAGVLNVTAKLVFQRHRPDFWVSPRPELDYGFPSGHAMGSLAFALALALLVWNTRWRWLALLTAGLFALVVGFSRLYLGVHFPSDVLAGFMASLAWVLGVFLIVRSWKTRRKT